MISPLVFPWNVLTYSVIGYITYRLFIKSGWFQNKLIGWKNSYENTPR